MTIIELVFFSVEIPAKPKIVSKEQNKAKTEVDKFKRTKKNPKRLEPKWNLY